MPAHLCHVQQYNGKGQSGLSFLQSHHFKHMDSTNLHHVCRKILMIFSCYNLDSNPYAFIGAISVVLFIHCNS